MLTGVAIVAMGFVVFQERPSPRKLGGIALVFAASAYYIYLKFLFLPKGLLPAAIQ